MSSLVVSARVGTQLVAFEAASVEAVGDIGAVTPIPFGPAPIAGLAAVRSQIVTVIDVAAAVGAGACAPDGVALLASVEGHRYALRVDSVDDVAEVDVDWCEPGNGGGGWAAAAIGRATLEQGLALVLDPAAIVTAGRD